MHIGPGSNSAAQLSQREITRQRLTCGLDAQRTHARPEDIDRFVVLCWKTKLPGDNRVVMVCRKGNKASNRDTIIAPVRDGRYRCSAP